jgi:hypothetical protein
LRVADRFSGRFADAPYFGNYERLPETWRLTLGETYGEPSIIVLSFRGAAWKPRGIVRLDVADGQIE